MEICKMTDYGNVPEFIVDGVGCIEFIGPTVRIGYFTAHKHERRLSLELRWPREAWLASGPIFVGVQRQAWQVDRQHGLIVPVSGTMN